MGRKYKPVEIAFAAFLLGPATDCVPPSLSWSLYGISVEDLVRQCKSITSGFGGMTGVRELPGPTPPTPVGDSPHPGLGGCQHLTPYADDVVVTLPLGRGAAIFASRGAGRVVVLGFEYDRGQGFQPLGQRWDPRDPNNNPAPHAYPYAMVPGALDPMPNNRSLRIRVSARQRPDPAGTFTEWCVNNVAQGIETTPPRPGWPAPVGSPSLSIATGDGPNSIIWFILN